MRRDFSLEGLGQAVPQVPPVADLDRAGQRAADGLAVGARAVAADDLDAWVIAQPRLHDIGGAAGQDIDAVPGLGVDEDGRVDRLRRSAKSSIPSTRGNAIPGSGIRSRVRSEVCRESGTPSAARSAAPARPANSLQGDVPPDGSRVVRR